MIRISIHKLILVCLVLVVVSCTSKKETQIDDKQARRDALKESQKYSVVENQVLKSVRITKMHFEDREIIIDSIIYIQDIAKDVVLSVIHDGDTLPETPVKLLKGESVSLVVGNGFSP